MNKIKIIVNAFLGLSLCIYPLVLCMEEKIIKSLSEQTSCVEKQIHLIRHLIDKEGRKATSEFPELLPYFYQNAQRVQDKLSSHESLKSEFCDFIKQCKTYFSLHGLDILHYNISHAIFAEFLTEFMGIDTKSKREWLFKAFPSKNIKLFLDISLLQPENPFVVLVSLVEELQMLILQGVTPLPVISEMGIFPLNLLNKSFASKVPLIGVSLNETSADGAPANPWVFFHHDFTHITLLTDRCGSNFDKMNIDLYDRYHQIHKLITHAICNEKQKNLYQIALFYIGHEALFGKLDVNELSIKQALISGMKQLHNWVDACLDPMHSRECLLNWEGKVFIPDRYKPQKYYEVSKMPPRHVSGSSHYLPENFKSISLVDYIKIKKIDTTHPLILGGLFPESSWYFWKIGGCNYNELLDFKQMLIEAGAEPLEIWKEGDFNSDGIRVVINTLFQQFEIFLQDAMK